MILNLIILPWRKGHWVLLSAEAFLEAQLIIWFLWSIQVFYPHISVIIRFVVDGVAKPVFVSVVVEADDSPTLSSLLSPPLPPPVVLGNSLSNSC